MAERGQGNRKADLATVGGRLRWAIDGLPNEGREYGLSLFSRKMTARDKVLRGHGEQVPSSRPSIRSYVENEATPPLIFFREAAAILNVRAEWLAFGSGLPIELPQQLPTSADNILDVRLTELGGDVDLAGATFKRYVEAQQESVWSALADKVPRWWDLSTGAQSAVVRAFGTYARLPSTLADFGDESPELADRFASYVAAPFTTLGVSADSLNDGERALVVMSLLQPLEVAAWAAVRDSNAG